MPDQPAEAFALDPLDIPDAAWVPRGGVRRGEDRKLYAFLLTFAVTAFSIGVAWATATAAVHQKVDKTDQVSTDAVQTARIERVERQLSDVLDGLRGLKVGVDSANLRLRQMACDGKPVSCR